MLQKCAPSRAAFVLVAQPYAGCLALARGRAVAQLDCTASIHTMLADGRENFIKHPMFKSFCRWQLAVNDQPVNIAFRDKGDFNNLLSSIPILIHLLNDPLAFR